MHAIDMIELLLLIIQFSALFQSGKRDSPAPCGPAGLPAGRCPGGAGSTRATGTRRPLPLCCGVVCSNPAL